MDRLALLDRIRRAFASHGVVPAALYLFGSVARGDARSTSDVDLALLGAADEDGVPTAAAQAAAEELRRVVGRAVDLVPLEHAPLDLIHRVLRDGLVVVEGDRDARIEFEMAARGAYLDLLPTLRAYRRRAIRSA